MQNIGKVRGELWHHFWSNLKTFWKVLNRDNLKGSHLANQQTSKVGNGQTILTQLAQSLPKNSTEKYHEIFAKHCKTLQILRSTFPVK